MSAPPPPALPASLSTSGYEDGLGARALAFDRECGSVLERVVVRPELAAFERSLRERADRFAAFDDERVARVREIVRDRHSGTLTVVSEFVAGHRLSDLLEDVCDRGRDENAAPSVDVALGFLLQILPALAALHSAAGPPHGAIGAGRTVITPAGQLVLLDPIYGPSLERLQFSRRRLWTELRIAAPPSAGPCRFDAVADLAQAAMAAVAITVGRRLADRDYPGGLQPLIDEAVEIAQLRGRPRFATALQRFFERSLPFAARRTYDTVDEACAAIEDLVAGEMGAERCRAALTDLARDPVSPPAPFALALREEPADAAAMVPVEQMIVEGPAPTKPPEAAPDPPAAMLSASATPEVPPVPPDPLPEREGLASTNLGPHLESERAQAALVEDEVAPAPVPEAAAAWRTASEPEWMADAAPEAEATAAIPAFEPVALMPPGPETAPAAYPQASAGAEAGTKFAPPADSASADRTESQSAAAAPATVPFESAVQAAPPPRKGSRGGRARRDRLRSADAPKAPPPVIQVERALRMPVIPAPGLSSAQPLRAPEPLWVPPAVVAIAPIAAPAVVAPQPTTTLRLKTDLPSGYAPASQPRARHLDDVYVRERPIVAPATHQTSSAWWKIAAAAGIAIAAGVFVGRSNLLDRLPRAVAPLSAVRDTIPAEAPVRPTGSIVVETEPSGARVLLDGQPAGDTPLKVDTVATGSHVITVITPKTTLKRAVKVEAGRTVSVDVPVYSGWLAIFAPIVLEVAERGQSIGSTEQGRLMLPPGRHTLTFSNRSLGYSAVQKVDIEAGEERALTMDPRGRINVNAVPWAEIFIDGERAGETPLANFDVRLGTREILFKHPDFGERRVTATVTATTPAIVIVDFTKSH